MKKNHRLWLWENEKKFPEVIKAGGGIRAALALLTQHGLLSVQLSML